MKPWLAGLAGAVVTAATCTGVRLWSNDRARRRLAAAARGDVRREWFDGFGSVCAVNAGDEVRFDRDPDASLYLVVGGLLRLGGSGSMVGPGALLTRADVAVVLADARLLGMSGPEVLKVYARHPEFGAFLLRLLASRIFERGERDDNVARFADYYRRSG